jgi:hypothetical protein
LPGLAGFAGPVVDALERVLQGAVPVDELAFGGFVLDGEGVEAPQRPQFSGDRGDAEPVAGDPGPDRVGVEEPVHPQVEVVGLQVGEG